MYGQEKLYNWVFGDGTEPLGGFSIVEWASALFASNQEQKYYTTPTTSTEDKNGNVINYYRGGDTTTTKIIDSYNKTFNTIHNTTSNTNNYRANVKLSDFLNSYTTNTNNYTYNTEYKSWYYDNTSNTFNYDASQTYYNTDNSRYYISIDNSTDEYYLVDIQYSPTFVTVNYTYNNIDNSTNYGDVTNVYYFELTDGRNSFDLTVDEINGMDIGLDAQNYELVSDDPNTLSLQHFDGNYDDSSVYGRTFYSENRSMQYVDSGEFGQALCLPNGSAAGVTIPGLSDLDSFTIDFRLYYGKIDHVANGIILGNQNLFTNVPDPYEISRYDRYSDDGSIISLGTFCADYDSHGNCPGGAPPVTGYGKDATQYGYTYSTSIRSIHTPPKSTAEFTMRYSNKFGWYITPSVHLVESVKRQYGNISKGDSVSSSGHTMYRYDLEVKNFINYTYSASPTEFVYADFNYAAFANEWISMRITVANGNLYYFVNGDLVGSGPFTMPTADKFFIRSNGTIYLDELRITTGDMVSSEVYNPSSAPFDTNKVLALPSELTANTIYVRNSTEITNWRIGGVRPSNPTIGFFYIPIHSDKTGGQSQIYDGSNWINVESVVFDGSSTHNTLGFTFNTVEDAPDVVDPNEQKPDDDEEEGTCSHDWQETSRTDPTCSAIGSVQYTCSKCEATKSETLSKKSHTWEVKSTVQTSYDDEGNVITEGYTIYRCTVCGEEYKDTDGSGPPSDSGSGWFSDLLNKIGDFLGSTVGALLELIGTIISKVLDSLISLISTTLEKLTQIVDLFGSFGEALGALWTWLPPEIMTVLVSAVTIIIFLAVLRIFLK